MIAFLDAEEKLIREKIDILARSGAKAIFTSKEVDDRIQHACFDNSILLVGMMEDDGIEDVAGARGGEFDFEFEFNDSDDEWLEDEGANDSSATDAVGTGSGADESGGASSRTGTSASSKAKKASPPIAKRSAGQIRNYKLTRKLM